MVRKSLPFQAAIGKNHRLNCSYCVSVRDTHKKAESQPIRHLPDPKPPVLSSNLIHLFSFRANLRAQDAGIGDGR